MQALRAWWFRFTNQSSYLEGLKLAESAWENSEYRELELCISLDFSDFDKGVLDYRHHANKLTEVNHATCIENLRDCLHQWT